MSVPSKLQPVLYGLGVFAIFIILSVVLKLITHRVFDDVRYFGILSDKDLLIGAFVAIVLTFTHERKKRLNK
jgi:hypothetical protein